MASNKRYEYKILVKTMAQYFECGKKEFGSSPKPKHCPQKYFNVPKYYKGYVASFNNPNSIYVNSYYWGETKEEALRRLFKEVEWK